ncbi:MAG: methyltransferase domain-containing protein [Nitrospinota bacterium]
MYTHIDGSLEAYQQGDCFVIKLRCLNDDVLVRLTQIIRNIKLSGSETVFFYISPEQRTNVNWSSLNFQERLKWSKNGQILTKLIEQSGHYFIAILLTDCYNEFFEIALACHIRIALDGIHVGFDPSGPGDIPKWGGFDRLVRLTGPHVTMNLLLLKRRLSSGEALQDKILDSVFEPGGEDSQIREIVARLNEIPAFYKYTLLKGPAQDVVYQSAADKFEMDLFSNSTSPYVPALENMEFTESGASDAPPSAGVDDLQAESDVSGMTLEDHFKKYFLNSAAVQNIKDLLESGALPIRGRCVELGAGGGWLSCLLTHLPAVTEVVALDISKYAIYRHAPILQEEIRPDSSKLKYVVGNVSKLKGMEGAFDTVCFCASLHHVSDVLGSMQRAAELLKSGGTVIFFNEAPQAMFGSRKLGDMRRRNPDVPRTIGDYKRCIRAVGLQPRVFTFYPGGIKRVIGIPLSRRFLLKYTPVRLLNGYYRFANFVMAGTKP